jgi:hypothetical protein
LVRHENVEIGAAIFFVSERHSCCTRDLREALQNELAVFLGKARNEWTCGRSFPSRESFCTVLCGRNLIDELRDPFRKFYAVSSYGDLL